MESDTVHKIGYMPRKEVKMQATKRKVCKNAMQVAKREIRRERLVVSTKSSINRN